MLGHQDGLTTVHGVPGVLGRTRCDQSYEARVELAKTGEARP